MKICILMGSPREKGNTAQLLRPIIDEFDKVDCCCELINLYGNDIKACCACRRCQNNWDAPDCAIDDDMRDIFNTVLDCDLLILASPIYSWYCTPPMKVALDRCVYALNKYYGDKKGPSLWEGKMLALVSTCGYPVDKGSDLWEAGIKRYCKHSQLHFLGHLSEHDPGYQESFMSEDIEKRARDFARKLIEIGGMRND